VCTERGSVVKRLVVVAAIAVAVVAIRSRNRVEVWHVAADQPT
jgi:hypothetical protein